MDSSLIIDEAVERLRRELKPVGIYVFGSRARGSARADSDLDLFVVVPDGFGDKISNTRAAYRATRGLPVSRDIVVDEEHTFLARQHWSSSLEREVLENGRLVYGKPRRN